MLQGPSRLHIVLLMLLAWGIIFPIPLWAKNQGSDSPSAPLKAPAPNEGNREEFLSRVTELRSLAKRKEALVSSYAGLAQLLKEVQSEAEGIETELSAMKSDKNPDIVKIARGRRLLIRSRIFSKLKDSGQFYMDLLVEEYDILSRLEELEAGYKAKAITKGDFASENRGLKEELFRLKTARQLHGLETGLIEGLGQLEEQLVGLSVSVH